MLHLRNPQTTATLVVLGLIISAASLSGCTRMNSSLNSSRDTTMGDTTYNQLTWPISEALTNGKNQATILARDTELHVLIADTNAEREKGLGERDSLPQDGMLFIIDPPVPTGIWMKGMRFALDVVWLSQGKVVHIEHNLLPAPGQTSPPVFGPDTAVDAIVELAAGRVNELGLATGSQMTLQGLE
jgi:uncharacterized membrane protein (UPF0127 family)